MFDSECGWPNFRRAIDENHVKRENDDSLGMQRTEIRSTATDQDGKVIESHLGHVFDDGPDGEERHCINWSRLRFIPRDEMLKDERYKRYWHLFDTESALAYSKGPAK